MAGNPTTYEWECPICGERRVGLSHGRDSPVVEEAENAILGHVRRTVGNGHGEEGEIPPGSDAATIADNVQFRERFGGQAAL